MTPRIPDDSINLEDSGTLDLNRLLTTRPPIESDTDVSAPQLPTKPRQRDPRSRDMLVNPFTAPDAGAAAS